MGLITPSKFGTLQKSPWPMSKLSLFGYAPAKFGYCTIQLITDIYIQQELRLLDSGNYSQVLKESETLCSVIGPVVKPGEKLRWTSLSPEDNANNNQEESINTTISNRDRICTVLKPSVLIPNDVPPTHLGCLAVVQLDYFLKVKACKT